MTLICADVVVTEPTLTPEERSVRETQSVITAAIRRTSTDDPLSGEFRIGYDVESPLTRLDFGGDDQERRHVHLLIFDVDTIAIGSTQVGRVRVQVDRQSR